MIGKLIRYLSRYNEYTCPDNYWLAWRALVGGEDVPHRKEVIEQAILDFKEEELIQRQTQFNNNRRRMSSLTKRKYNWSSK